MTALQNIESACSAPAEGSLAWLLTVGLLAGCLGGSGEDPKLEAQKRAGARQTISTAEFQAREEPADESEAQAEDGSEADMDSTPAPLDNPQPAEPAPASPGASPGASFADDSVYCGNGDLDDDELCDVAIAEGETGACPSRCSDDPCAPEVLEVHTCWSVCLPVEPAPGACT